MNRLLYIIMCVLLLLSVSVGMEGKGVDRHFYEAMSKLSSEQLNRRGNYYTHDGSQPDSAFMCYSIVTRRYHAGMSNDDIKKVISAWHGLWYIYFFYHYDFARAMECLRKFQSLARQARLSDMECRPWLMKGVMYETVADETGDTSLVREASRCYQEALKGASKMDDEVITINAFSNLMLIMADYPDKRVFADAYKYLDKISTVSKKQELPYKYALTMYGNVKARIEGDFRAALKACDRMMEIGKNVTCEPRYLLSAYSVRSKTYAQMGDYHHAISDLRYLEDQAKATQYIDFLMPVCKDLQGYYVKIGDKRKADYYRRQHFELKDSLLSYHQMASVKEMSFIGEMEDMEAQVAAAERRNFIWMVSLVISLLIASVIAVALVLLRRKNRELDASNKMLYEKNVALLKADDERKKYQRSNLDDVAKQTLQQTLREVMDNTEEYLSVDFSIARLAEMANSTTKVVSQVINECFGNNFNAFVNEYRIRRACQMMDGKERVNLTIEAIGNEVGFKSRSSFVTAFKRFTGLTPSNYLSMASHQH